MATTRLQEQLDAAIREANALKTKYAEHSDMYQNYESLRNEHHVTKEELKANQIQNKNLHKQVKDLEIQLQNLKNKKPSPKQQRTQTEHKIASLEAQVSILKSNNADLELQLRELGDTHAGTLKGSADIIETLNKQKDRMFDELAEAKERVKNLEQMNTINDVNIAHRSDLISERDMKLEEMLKALIYIATNLTNVIDRLKEEPADG